MKFSFDSKKFMEGIHTQIKSGIEFEVNCPKCGELVGKYTHDYLKEKGELFCENCKDIFLINV